jgi:hypothetical protein
MGYESSNPTGTISTSVPLEPVPGGTISDTFTSNADLGTTQVFSAGTSFDCLKFVGSAEVAHLWSNGSLVRSATGAYGSVGYRVLPRLTPYFLYSWMGNLSGTSYVFPDPAISATPKTDQHSEVFGFNFKMSPAAVLKLEYMRTQADFVDTTQSFGANTFTASVDLVF